MKVRNIEFEGTPYNEQTYNWRTIPSELTTEQKLALLEAMGIHQNMLVVCPDCAGRGYTGYKTGKVCDNGMDEYEPAPCPFCTHSSGHLSLREFVERME